MNNKHICPYIPQRRCVQKARFTGLQIHTIESGFLPFAFFCFRIKCLTGCCADPYNGNIPVKPGGIRKVGFPFQSDYLLIIISVSVSFPQIRLIIPVAICDIINGASIYRDTAYRVNLCIACAVTTLV